MFWDLHMSVSLSCCLCSSIPEATWLFLPHQFIKNFYMTILCTLFSWITAKVRETILPMLCFHLKNLNQGKSQRKFMIWDMGNNENFSFLYKFSKSTHTVYQNFKRLKIWKNKWVTPHCLPGIIIIHFPSALVSTPLATLTLDWLSSPVETLASLLGCGALLLPHLYHPQSLQS